tara:strand:- start:1898 stop:2407 length:510 start_codon:yes stop_codon:yes gene_type:complete
MSKNIVLLGMMAVGKSTLGKIVAKKLKLEFFDTDLNIEKKNSMTINQIFETKGEAFFRKEEEKEVLQVLKKKNCIIALGGGAFLNNSIRGKILKSCLSIWLETDIKTLNERLKRNNKRPLLKKNNNLDKLTKLYEERKNIYKLANYKIICDELSKLEIAKKIIEFYENK